MIVIDENLVLTYPLRLLRTLIYKEDRNEDRYRERIIKAIEKFGVKNWFKARGLPTEEDSKWINRYTKCEMMLSEELTAYARERTFEESCYYLWENWLPVNMWDNDNYTAKGLDKWL